MKTELKWTGGMSFAAETSGNTIIMDSKAPLGQNKGMTPKELVANGLGGCTAMDVVALLKKHKQVYDSFEVSVDIESSTGGHPIVFTNALITFSIKGNVDKDILIDSVKLSQSKFCGVSAMLLKAFPINYIVILNNEEIATGHSKFEV